MICNFILVCLCVTACFNDYRNGNVPSINQMAWLPYSPMSSDCEPQYIAQLRKLTFTEPDRGLARLTDNLTAGLPCEENYVRLAGVVGHSQL